MTPRTPSVKINVQGARGESQADILRRTGQYGVLPTDTDEEVMDKLASAGVAEVLPDFAETLLKPYVDAAEEAADSANSAKEEAQGLVAAAATAIQPGEPVTRLAETDTAKIMTAAERDNLAKALYYRSAVSTGSVNALTTAGTYIVQNGVTDLPGALASGLLEVFDFDSGNFIIQSFVGTTNSQINVRYERICRVSADSYPGWVDTSIVPDNAISRPKLTVAYSASGAVNSGSANALTATGIYTVATGVTDLPAGLTSGLMEVVNSADFVKQSFYSATSSAIRVKYERITRPSTGSYPGWNDITTLADASVSRLKLAASYSNNGGVSTGSVNALTATGVYTIQTGVTDLPGGLTSGLLEVNSYGDFFHQCVYSATSSAIQTKYERICRVSTSSYPGWVQVNTIARSNLTDSFANNGIVSTGSFNDYFREGNYTIGAALADAPSGAPTTGLLRVYSWGGTFVIQEFVSSTATAVLTTWKRNIRPGTSYGAWLKEAPVTSTSRWTGRKVAFVGDSIFRQVSSTWPASVATALGLANGYQGGVAGCTMGRRQFVSDPLNDYLRELGFTKLVDAMVSGDWTAPIAAATYCKNNGGDTQLLPAVTALSTVDYSTLDGLLVGFGTNDWGNYLPIGEDEDDDWTNFKGAINYGISAFMTAFPTCRIMFTAPLWRARNAAGDGKDADIYPNASGVYLRDYVTAMIERCGAHKVPVLDLYHESGINQFNANTLFQDGLHPWTVPGNQRMADKISAFMERSY